MLEKLNNTKIENPVDYIISEIRQLISSGEINAGEKLPPERKLAEKLGVSRGQIREAINKLQIYGIVKVQPQSGTVVNSIGITAIEGLITDILQIEPSDFKALVDTRILLEKEAARLAALHRTEADLANLSNAISLFEEKFKKGEDVIEEDLLFHIKIAEASKNTVLKSLMLIITPDIAKNFIDLKVCNKASNTKTMNEHRKILEMITDRNEEGAVKAMEDHLKDAIQFSENFDRRKNRKTPLPAFSAIDLS